MDKDDKRRVIKEVWQSICDANWDVLTGHVTEETMMYFSEGLYVKGPAAAAQFWSYYQQNYDLSLAKMDVIVTDTGAAVESVLRIKYVRSKQGLPEAKGQETDVPVATFVTFAGDKISRTRFVYSLADWMRVFEGGVVLDHFADLSA